MGITFKEVGHKYESVDPNENIVWTSVTSLVGKFKPEFDNIAISEKCSKNKKSKWYGISPERIREIWSNEAFRATDLGTFYHNSREVDLLKNSSIIKDGYELQVIAPEIIDGVKFAPNQKITEGVYPEHMVYLKSAGICGQADYVDVINGSVNILDYKTNKEIKTRSFESWDGLRQMLNGPLSHLEDCSLIHYTLQMSVYMYIILKHNPRLKPGIMTLEHVIFEQAGEDEFGYPIYNYNEKGEPIVQETVLYEVEYMKEEVLTMINWLKTRL